MADKLAKDTAYKLFKGEVLLSTNVTVSSAFNMSVEISRKSWQRLWENKHSGRYTHNLIPYVNTKVFFPTQRDIGISYCRLLLHDYVEK